MFKLNMEVNKKEGGEYKLVGKVEVPVFELKAFGISIDADAVSEEGLPTYKNPSLQYVQDAITAAIKAAARNKLIGGSVALKPGNKIASTVAELLESGGNNGAALALHREFITDFANYLATKSGKNAGVQSLYTGLVKAKATIALSTEARRNGLAAQLEAFLVSLPEVDQAKYLNIVSGLSDLCEGATDLDDSDL